MSAKRLPEIVCLHVKADLIMSLHFFNQTQVIKLSPTGHEQYWFLYFML